MTKILLTLIVAATLAACATPQRQGPPAPVVSAAQPKPAPVVAPPPPAAPAPRPVEVYAYRPPSEAARIPDEVAAAPPGTDVGAQAPNPDASAAAAPAASARREVAPPSLPTPAGVKTATQPESTGASVAPEVAAAAQPATPATPADALRVQAEGQRQSGDFAGAAATLERALSYQPRDAGLWNRLARVRMEQGLNSQAANLAAKSNSLAGGADQAALRQDNWSIIATAKRQTGDAAGAQEAELKARGA